MKPYCFGIDVGGTTVKIGLFQTDGVLLDQWQIHTRTENFGQSILSDICESLDAKLAEKHISVNRIEGLGFGIPGPVLDDGTVLQCVNLGWTTFNIVTTMSQMFHHVPVRAGNDANVAALGEHFMGACKGYSDIVMITLGTGVGSGIIIGGKIVSGYQGGAGEIGHIRVNDEEKELCGCMGIGCLEQYTSATGVVRLAKRYLNTTKAATKMHDYGKRLTAKDVFDLAKAGDPGANVVIGQMSEYLGRAIAMIAAVLNPQAFVIGGGVSQAGQFLIDRLATVYRKYSFHPCDKAELCLAELGNDAGIYGAAALIIRNADID